MYYKGELQPTLKRYYYRPSIHSNSHLCINAVHDMEHNWVKAASEASSLTLVIQHVLQR